MRIQIDECAPSLIDRINDATSEDIILSTTFPNRITILNVKAIRSGRGTLEIELSNGVPVFIEKSEYWIITVF